MRKDQNIMNKEKQDLITQKDRISRKEKYEVKNSMDRYSIENVVSERLVS